MDIFTQSPEGKLWEGEPTSGSAPTGGDTSAPASPAATPQAPATQSATPTAPQAPATGAPGEGWVPSYRVRETREAAIREAREAFAQREAEIRAEADKYRNQVLALTGVQPPQDPATDAVRKQFAALFPKLAQLEERGEDVFGLLERAGDLDTQADHYWSNYGRQSMDRLYSGIQTALGGTLTEEGKRIIHSSFVGFVQSSPEMQSRYANDPTIVDDFVKAYSTNFIDPVRRSTSATVQGRAAAAIPQDTPGGVPRATPGPKLENLDERAAAGFARFKQLTGRE